MLLSRVSARATWPTAREEVFDSKWQGELAPFGETVLFHETVSHTVSHMRAGAAPPDAREIPSKGKGFTLVGRSGRTSASLMRATVSSAHGRCDA